MSTGSRQTQTNGEASGDNADLLRKKPKVAGVGFPNQHQTRVTVVLGAQWGDEGKGKVVDMLATEADLVCRCQVSL